jgi:hypothetical protein
MTSKHIWPWETLPPGIYFNMPFDDYKKQRCLNAGGIKNMLISETDFWCRSWMNPLCDEIDEETKAKEEGRAYHARILEGRDVFNSQYAPDYEDDKDDKSILRTNKDMTEFLKSLGVKGASGKNAEELTAMCLDADPNVNILSNLKNDYIKRNAGKTLIDPLTIRQIELAAKMIECHPELKTYFAGGYPEVTVIWDDEELGVRFKIRIDYLKTAYVCDLKTFANLMKKEINKAIEHSIAANKYQIQAYLYLRGVYMAKQFAASGMIHGTANADWLKVFAETPCDQFWYVFMQKGIAPVARGAKWLLDDKSFADAGYDLIKKASEKFKSCYNTFGEDPWIDMSKSHVLSYDSMPSFINDV